MTKRDRRCRAYLEKKKRMCKNGKFKGDFCRVHSVKKTLPSQMCHNEQDPILLEEWSKDNPPALFFRIKGWDKKHKSICYAREPLLRWLKLKVQEISGKRTGEKFVKMPDGHKISARSVRTLEKNPNTKHWWLIPNKTLPDRYELDSAIFEKL